ncbi:hypothetical protein JTE90_028567 [Oedothorax gibbosus]|uniref:Uncharacterized protein n=1 Tax=Oedothorax gibbosus TaxID=931172 RepID=A0AAV6VWD3_9ARAC|nr:hypothetical protein JTE90_028567 [Oedothorax gibbosus]
MLDLTQAEIHVADRSKAEESHSQLERETREARDKAEAEECEEVIGVAKRNVEGLVQDILKAQKERMELVNLLEAEKAGIRQEEAAKNRQLLAEVGKITRNVILLQTRLLILEEKRFERDKLFGEVRDAEEKLATEGEQQEIAMEMAYGESRGKYKKLYSKLHDEMESVSSFAGRVGCAQQVAALRDRCLQILETQGRLRRVEGLMLGLHRQNEVMREEVRSMRREMESYVGINEMMDKDSRRALQELQAIIQIHDAEEIPDSSDELLMQLKSLIHDLQQKVFKMNDQRTELQEVLADQECYQKMLQQEDRSRQFTRERLVNMSRVAELVMEDNQSSHDREHEMLAKRSSFLSEMSTILLETTMNTEDVEELPPQSEVSIDSASYSKGLLGLVPEETVMSRSKSHTPSSFFTMPSE